MPTQICSRIFNKIEEMNPDISINVWEWKEESVTLKPVIASKNFKRQYRIRLLALTNITKSEDGKYGQKNHFLWIKNPSRLIYGDSAHKEKKYLCDGCTQSWPSEKSLEHHLEWCSGIHENASQRVIMPVKGVNDFEEFKNYGRMINAPCVIIADFEADNKKCDKKYGRSIRKLAEQKANSFCYLVHWIDTGNELVHINEVLAIKHERIETEEDKKRFAKADTCWICKGKIAIDRKEVKCLKNKASWLNNKLENTPKNLEDYKALTTQILKVTKAIDQAEAMDIKVWDYCYITGKFRGSAHRDRNLKLQIQDWKTPIPETELSLYHEFHSTLKSKITLDDYQHAQKVWKEFGCKNLGEYHDIYLKTDVLSLADVWTEFRKMSMEYYELDLSHYVSAPLLSWDAQLKMTGANNPKMGEAYDPSKPTSWISYVDATNLYGHSMSQYFPIRNYQWEASQEYLLKNPAMQKKYLEKILNTRSDAKRGYFLNINAHFPFKTHDYLSDLPPAVENIAVGKDWLSPYNTELVNNLDGGRFSATEKLVPHLGLRKDYVIHYQELQYYVELGMVVDEVSEILSFDQTNWLEPYISFNTEKRNEAKKAGNTFLSDFFKLMNVSVYGKTMENVRKYQDVKIMKNNNERDEKAFLKKVRKPSFKYARQLENTLIEAHMGKASVTLNKPIIVGASVLDLSKLHMYEFWYGYVKEKYGDKARLEYMNTDSYIFETETEDIYRNMAERPDFFNLNEDQTVGNYKDETPGNTISLFTHIWAKLYYYVLAECNPDGKTTNSKHKGISKKGMCEMATDTYFPSLGGTLLDDPVDEAKIFDLMTQVYLNCLFGKEVFYAKNVGIRSKDHILSLVETEKKALCPIDTKHWILLDGITTLPYRHWRNMIYKNMVKDGIPHEEAEKRAMRAKLPEKYQNEYVSHISSSPT
ncbi:hypothetical protein RclHR1_08350021 [Rhizophagus clarus]|uniref:DNA-directed DNA polymerase n=1 Tax=Rhizophagus clarus TaxID=94130 RepID=A0A2Z6S2K7_9GLOM|nr:hypothetical protein RclHR1_08350021 [Rhizophagus clarus]